MNDLQYLAACILVGFAGLSGTLVSVFGRWPSDWILPVSLTVAAGVVVLMSMTDGGDGGV